MLSVKQVCRGLVSGLLLLPLSLWAADQYQVVKVKSWDTLSLRAEPGANSALLAKIPYDATGIRLVGEARKVGSTDWVKISWEQQTGWVSKAYLAVGTASKASEKPAEVVAKTTDKADQLDQTSETVAEEGKAEPEPEPAKPPTPVIQKDRVPGMWVLECGNAAPFWKVEVLPEWIKGTLGKHHTGMPITHKRQEHGAYHNVALETEVKGENRWNRLELNVSFTKSCYSTLQKKKVSFHVTGYFNDKEIEGCCHALQVK